MTATDQTGAETEALRLKAILESAVAGIITIDSEGLIETVNASAERLFGYRAVELAGRNVSSLMPEPYRSQHDMYLARYLSTGVRKVIGIGREVHGLRRDGSVFPMHLSIGEFSIGERRFFTGIVHDLSVQRAVEARLDREQALFRSIFETLPDPLIVCDPHGVIRLVNPAFSQTFGYGADEVVGFACTTLCEAAGDWQKIVGAGAQPDPGQSHMMRFRRQNGETFPARAVHTPIVDRNGKAVGSLNLVHDVTAEREQAAALQQSQRMEAIGQLTGGVAHDFNNLLTVILGNLELLEPKLPDALSVSLAGEAREAAEMGARLTDRLLTFARRQRLETRRINLNEFVLNLTELLRRTIGADVDLSTALAADLWQTEADPGQIENAVLNLAINARDAMPDGGRLLIETRNTTLDETDVVAIPGLAAGHFVVLSVADTGHGMSPEVMERAFEPFFTTKGPAKGSGLGLATIYGFARQSGGNVTIYSEIGHGTTVNLYLPRAKGETAPDAAKGSSGEMYAGRGEVILIVEDDDRVRRLTAARLNNLGYRVHEAANGQAALDVMAATPGIDLVFSDLVMPGGTSGLDLARIVRERYPGTRLVLTSGYSAELIGQEKVDLLGLKVLRKPYRQAELARVLRETLDGGAA